MKYNGCLNRVNQLSHLKASLNEHEFNATKSNETFELRFERDSKYEANSVTWDMINYL